VHTFAVTLHVLSAVFVIGPLVFAALGGYRAVRRHDPGNARSAVASLVWFNGGSVLVAVLGLWAVSTSDRVTFRTPWVTISLTLFVIMMGLATGYTMPALRKAARILDEGVLARPAVTVPDDEGATPAARTATATELVTKERLDQLAGRIAASGGLVALAAVAITIFMVVKPFGD
jgi:MFS family permease